MRSWILGGLSIVLSISLFSTTFAQDVVDNQLLEKENIATGSTTENPNFSIQKFESCEDMESTIADIIKKYNWGHYYGRPVPMLMRGAVMEDAIGTANVIMEKSVAQTVPSSAGGKEEAYSETNVQVAGVDEAEIVKTDGKFIYFYNDSTNYNNFPYAKMAVNGVNTANDGKNVYIVEKESLEIIKRIRIPDSYNNTELYTFSGKLIVVANKYGNINNRWYGWYQNNIKTVVAIYDISNPKLPKLDRYTQFDGTLSQSRLIDGKLYIIATNPLTLPQIYAQEKDISEKFTETFSVRNTIPRIIDTYKKTLETKYTRENRPAIQCSEMEYILPDKATADKYSFNPAFSIIAMIDVANTNTPISSKMIFGDVGEIHMSTKSLYLVSNIWSESTNNRCPMNARCFAPSFGQSTTLVHKFTLNNTPASYVYTTLLNGNLLNQYSMDEEVNTGYFRILTQVYGNWENGQNNNSTELSILGTDGKILGNLKNIGLGENFQSSRFIGNRLYLVTFEQIDPLFVIDLTSPTEPKILGELKMPGYSTYLHPYDANRLIGIGYDTFQNQWGGTQNGGLKIDLYNVGDVKNPKKESSLVLGDAGSSSDVLHNPRMFVWYKEKNLLLMPALLMKSAKNQQNPYQASSAWQGTVVLNVKPEAITESGRITHLTTAGLEEKWKKDCAQYSNVESGKPKCHKLIGGGEYCEPQNQQYVPPYCYEGSTLETYLAQNIWQMNSMFILRNLYIGNTIYTLSPEKIKTTNLETFADIKETPWKK